MTTLQLSAEDNTTRDALKKADRLLGEAYQTLKAVGANELMGIINSIGSLIGDLEDIKIDQYEVGEWEAYAKANNGGF